MAVTNLAIVRDGLTLTRTFDSKDSITKVWEVTFDSEQFDPLAVYIAARDHPATGAEEDALPVEGEVYDIALAPHLFANSFAPKPKNKTDLKLWRIPVTWSPPPEGEEPPDTGDPLLRDAEFNMEFMEAEYPIVEAENLIALPHGDAGKNRPAFQRGPVLNGAGKRGDEPLTDTTRNPVITIKKNYGSLFEIYGLNQAFLRTTNQDSFSIPFNSQGWSGVFEAETLKYMVTDSEGPITEGPHTYWAGTTRIEVAKSTLLSIDNQGYAFWEPNDESAPQGPGKIVDDQEAKDLLILGVDGRKLGLASAESALDSTLQYRFLQRKPYQAQFFL